MILESAVEWNWSRSCLERVVLLVQIAQKERVQSAPSVVGLGGQLQQQQQQSVVMDDTNPSPPMDDDYGSYNTSITVYNDAPTCRICRVGFDLLPGNCRRERGVER